MSYQNGQLWDECALVSIWNAARFWGISPVPQKGSPSYLKICSSIKGAKSGGCSFRETKTELHRLGLILKKIENPWSFESIRSALPVELTIYSHRDQGLHSCLAIGVQDGHVLVCNYYNNHIAKVSWSNIKRAAGYYGGKESVEEPVSIVRILDGKRPLRTVAETYGRY